MLRFTTGQRDTTVITVLYIRTPRLHVHGQRLESEAAHTILSENMNICHEVGGAAAAGVRVGVRVYTRHGLKQSPLPVASFKPPLFARGSSPQPSPTIRGDPAGKTPSVHQAPLVHQALVSVTALEGCEDIVPLPPAFCFMHSLPASSLGMKQARSKRANITVCVYV